jgi:DnaJ-class molecular chaperone
VDVVVSAHEFFARRGNDILCEVPVHFVQAALGAEIEVPTLTGTATLKIPAGTQTGKIFKLKGKGISFMEHNNYFHGVTPTAEETEAALKELDGDPSLSKALIAADKIKMGGK